MADVADNPSVYIETTIVGLLTSRLSNDVITLANQMVTRDWWKHERPRYDLFTSDFTLDEAGDGDSTAAAERLDALRGVPVLAASLEAEALAAELEVALALPARARRDAGHIAVAAVGGMNYLLTWNCKHIANAALIPTINRTCAAKGLVAPRIATPLQLSEPT